MPIDEPEATIGGSVAAGYEAVRDAFMENFRKRGELGAACAIFKDGLPIVDLWGGCRDKSTGALWDKNTMVLVFSLTKGIAGLTAAVAESKGLFSYGQRVSEIWEGFEQHGKGELTIDDLLSQKCGLAAIDLKLTTQNMSDHPLIGRFIAAQKPNWKPGDYAGNHAHTIGWLVSELIRRTDGRTLGQYFKDEVAKPLGIDDFHIGLPDEFDEAKLARVDAFTILRAALPPWGFPLQMIAAMIVPWSLTSRTFNNPPAYGGPGDMDKPAQWRIENGGAGGIGTARAIAAIYSEFATGGKRLGIRRETLNALETYPQAPNKGWKDRVIKAEIVYSLGLEKPTDSNHFGTSGAAYGTFAVGGSYAYGDPAARVAYAYVSNRIVPHLWGERREYAVRKAFMNACAEQG